MKTLVVLAHPSIDERSLANRIIIEKIRTIAGVTIKDLYKECPSFKFVVEAEQKVRMHAERLHQYIAQS